MEITSNRMDKESFEYFTVIPFDLRQFDFEIIAYFFVKVNCFIRKQSL